MLHRGKTSSNGTQEPNGSPTPAIHDERHTTPVMTRKPAATRPCCSAASPAADPSCCRSGFSRELLIWAPSNGVGLTSVAVQRSAGFRFRLYPSYVIRQSVFINLLERRLGSSRVIGYEDQMTRFLLYWKNVEMGQRLVGRIDFGD